MTNSPRHGSDAINTKEAAGYLGMSEAWVRKQILRRKLPHFKLNRAVRFRRDDLEAYMEARRVEEGGRSE